MGDVPQQQGKEKESVEGGRQAGPPPTQAADAGTTVTDTARQAGTSGDVPNRSQQSVTARERFPLASWGDGPFTMMRRFSEEMDRFMDRVFEEVSTGRGWLASRLGRSGERGLGLWSPQVEIYERESQLVVCADLPGLKKENISIDFSDDALTIQGERRQEYEEKQPGYRQSERSYGSFSRTIPLPKGIDAEKAQATYQDGVLKITMPMPQQREQRGRRIEIQ